jgi:formiminotetrahydrofolate cyclodeaminase
MKLAAKPLTDLLADLRSSAPTPGGGSASAIAGAMGASLLAMVAALPKSRANSATEIQDLERAGERAAEIARDLEALVDRDSEAYERVVGAYRMPKGTDEEKAARSAEIQAALNGAIEAPLDVMRGCAAALALGPVLQALGNASASSDVQVGLELLRAGLRGARLNVEINLGSVKDETYAAAVSAEARRLSESGETAAPSASS